MGNDEEPETIGAEARAWFEQHWDPARPAGEWWDLLADAGYAFPTWPAEAGGRGLSKPAGRAVEAARAEVGAFGANRGIATFLVAPILLTWGTDDQRARYLPGIVRGRDVWCQLFSEPGSGSDLASLSTRAERDGDQWVVTGQKVWNSGAQHARYGILMARSDPGLPKHRGIGFFLLDMHQPGVDVRPLREMTGDAAFNEVFLAEARIDDGDLVGQPGDGWRVGMTTLTFERDPDNVGTGPGMFYPCTDLSMPIGDYAAAVESHVDGFGLSMSGDGHRLFDRLRTERAWGDDPVRRQDLARIAIRRRVAQWTTRRAGAGSEPGPAVSTLKLLGTGTGRLTRDTGWAAMGPEGMLLGDDAPTGGQFHAWGLFTPASSIAGGSDEIQHNIIGERILGLPREPGEADQRELPWKDLPRS